MTREVPRIVLCPGCKEREALRHCEDGRCRWFVCACACGCTTEGVWVKEGVKRKLVVKRSFCV